MVQELSVVDIKIGASAKFQVVLPSDFSSYTDIEANVISAQADELVISKNKKVAATGYKTIVVDPTNTKATWIYVEATESQKASAGLYICDLKLSIADASYPSGVRVEKYSIPVIMFKK